MKNALTETYTEDGRTFYRYDCDFIVHLAGDSIWDCELEMVHVDAITVVEEEDMRMVNVDHDGGEDSWRIYTDSGFENAISEALGFPVRFTEQGMQDDGYASMEAVE